MGDKLKNLEENLKNPKRLYYPWSNLACEIFEAYQKGEYDAFDEEDEDFYEEDDDFAEDDNEFEIEQFKHLVRETFEMFCSLHESKSSRYRHSLYPG